MERDIIQARLCSTDDLSEEIRQKLTAAPDHMFCSEDSIYMLLGRTVCILPDDSSGKALAYAFAHARNSGLSKPGSAAELYEKILHDENYRADPSMLRQYGIVREALRYLLAFRSYSPLEKDLCSVICSMAPMEAADVLIPIDYQTALFIKEASVHSENEIKEFAEALIGTMEAEGVVDIRAGIGGAYAGEDGIRKGYTEALKALDLGNRYHPEDHVSVYSEQMLERIIDAIPAEKKNSLKKIFFGEDRSSGFSDEMIETVRVFFRNDLNLTAASKQLFIHRNTLNYRLDKIKKDFGLDLRSFSDAVIFRIMSEIASEIPPETRN